MKKAWFLKEIDEDGKKVHLIIMTLMVKYSLKLSSC